MHDVYLANQVEKHFKDCRCVIGSHIDEDGETITEWSCDECDEKEKCSEIN